MYWEEVVAAPFNIPRLSSDKAWQKKEKEKKMPGRNTMKLVQKSVISEVL